MGTQGHDAPIERVIAIDWSGRVDAAGQRRHIWAATWTRAGLPKQRSGDRLSRIAERGVASRAPGGADRSAAGAMRLENGRTRDEIGDWLLTLAKETPRMVVGVDMCFSFPEWFVRGELGIESAPEFWRLVAESHGERWLTRRPAEDPEHDPRFWGKPHKRPPEFSGENLHRMLRVTDIDCKIVAQIPEAERAARVKGITPKSVFQIGGSGSVGTASLRGMPVLLRLHEAGFRIWPFDRPALAGRDPKPLVVEMYTRLNTGAVHKANPVRRAEYLRERQRNEEAYATLSRGVLAKARGSEDAFDALVSCMRMVERREGFARLPVPRDPAHRIEGWTWAPDLHERSR